MTDGVRHQVLQRLFQPVAVTADLGQSGLEPGLESNATLGDNRRMPVAHARQQLLRRDFFDPDAATATFELREVETGLASFDKAEVVKGLKAGDVVAVEDTTRPKEKKSND